MGIKLKENEVIALGGLLHDIGKFYNRGTDILKGIKKRAHPFLSVKFLEKLEEMGIIEKNELLKTVIQRHHEYYRMDEDLLVQNIKDVEIKKMALLMSRADNVSSKERDEKSKEQQNYKTRELDNIFQSLDIKGEKIEITQSYDLETFEPANIFARLTPAKGRTLGVLDTYIEDYFEKELEKIISPKDDFHSLFTKLLYLFEKYLWCIPSDTQTEIADISLFDHLKTTSAIALAGYMYHKDQTKITQEAIKNNTDKKYLLIGGDISGIQNYIYGINTTKNIAKRLRSRSFYVKMISETVSYRIIKELNLTPANIVLNSGGKFYILAPNTEEVVLKLDKIKKETENWLYEKMQAELYLPIEGITVSNKEMENFTKLYTKLNDKLSEAKSKKFSDKIINNPILEDNYKGTYRCTVCNKFWAKENGENQICEFCKNDEKIGRILPKTNFMGIYFEKPYAENEIQFFDGKVYVAFFESEVDIHGTKPYIIINMVDNEILSEYPAGYKPYAGYIPTKKNGEPKTFEEIANKSEGVKNLAVMKSDVDNLGLIFSIGLEKEDGESNLSISRVSTMSRMLEMFFSGWIAEQMKKEDVSIKLNIQGVQYPIPIDMSNNYIVYSGGDDLMILGPWNQMIYTAKYIKDEFRKFVGKNDQITISTGIELIKHHEPMLYASKKATEKEEQAKNAGKNCLSVFGRVIPWDDFNKVFEFACFLEENRQEEVGDGDRLYSQSFLYRLLKYTTMAEDYFNDTKQVEKLQYIPRFMYDIERNIAPKVWKYIYGNEKPYDGISEEEKEKLYKSEEIDRLINVFRGENGGFNYKKEEKNFLRDYMRVALNWVVRKNRDNEGGENGEI